MQSLFDSALGFSGVRYRARAIGLTQLQIADPATGRGAPATRESHDPDFRNGRPRGTTA